MLLFLKMVQNILTFAPDLLNQLAHDHGKQVSEGWKQNAKEKQHLITKNLK